jgi:hypothetical protein
MRTYYKTARARVGLARIQVTRDDGRSAMGARVFVDKRLVGEVGEGDTINQEHLRLSSNEVYVDAGSRTFTATYDGCEDGTATIAVGAGSSVEAGILLSCQKKLSMPIVVTGVALATAGLGLGIGAMVHSNAKGEEAGDLFTKLYTQSGQGSCLIEANQALCDELDSAFHASQTFKGIAVGGFVFGGVVAVATTVYVLATRSSSAPARAKEAPIEAGFSVGPGGGSAVIRGAF